ncbi:MAG: VPLPA-CTERM sorting domain-containing protein [Gammaproteobacteria bacterium]|nr:VPLPA-CTERM sorting domain-containing protein [Gammaproteobacteria bacterium]
MRKKNFISAGIIASSMLAGGSASAASAVWDVDVNPLNGFGGITSSWAVDAAGSAYAAWNVFDSMMDTTPDAGSFGPGPQSVQELTGGAFITGGGNIYGFAAATSFAAVLTGYGTESATHDLVLRIETLGTAVDPGSVLMNGIAPTISQLLYTEVLGGLGGNEEERLFVWSGVDGAAAYNFDFSALGSSMSLDQVALYAGPAQVVPVPAAIWLFGSALASLGAWRRRRAS